MLLLVPVLSWRRRLAQARGEAPGAVFRLFALSYCGWRLVIDGMKPGESIAGLTPIQWTAAAVLVAETARAVNLVRR